MRRSSLPGWVAALILALAPAALAQSPPPPADPFYLSLLQEGIQSFEEGDAKAAAKSLRLACFGLLEDPVALTGCLVRLGLAQAEGGDRDGFSETFRRLAAVEQRFSAYRAAGLEDSTRWRFEQWLVRLVPEQQLAAEAAFAELAEERIEVKLRRMAARERRKDLEGRLTQEPGNRRWPLLLAELEVEEGKPAEALARVEVALAEAPEDGRARCVRGLARAASGACPGAIDDLFPCPRSRAEPAFAEALLSCQVSLSQWPGASELLAALPAELREERRIAKLAQRVERESAAAAEAASEQQAAEAAEAEPPPQAEPLTPAPEPASAEATAAGSAEAAPPDLSPADREKLDHAQQLAAGVQHAGQLAEPLRLAAEVALANPASTEAQHLAALLAYRASRWQEAVTYFQRGGDPGDDRPVLLFYQAVSLYETGDREAAAATLERALPKLERTPFVESYRRKILGEDSAGASGSAG